MRHSTSIRGGDSGTAKARYIYESRLDVHKASVDALSRRLAITARLRVLVFVVGGVVAWMVFGDASLPVGWIAIPVSSFAALLLLHSDWRNRSDQARRAATIYQRGLDRIQDNWVGAGVAGEQFRDPTHPDAEDLDLLGEGSLFELLCSARTQAGEATLASWLLCPADPHEVRLRQKAVAELTGKLDLREDITRLGEDVRVGIHPQELRDWGNAPGILGSRAHTLTAAAAAVLSVSTLVAWLATSVGSLPFVVSLSLGLAWFLSVGKQVFAVIREVGAPTRDLTLFSHLLERIEKEPFISEKLVGLQAALETERTPPFVQIARLRRLVALTDACRNQLFLPIAIVLFLPLQVACAIDRWRTACGPKLGQWIDSVGEFEALMSLANFHFENEDHTFPQIKESGGTFHGIGLGHPLLPAGNCIRNDVTMVEPLQVLIFSGSNMSGKSTLLRAVGTNVVLALAGGPVRAHSLKLSPLTLGASIRVHDSLRDGCSRFYAEIRRLSQIVDLAGGEKTLLFLLDEVLSGTNSHDREIGVGAVVRSLIAARAIGIVTTHDLALTKLGDSLGDHIGNFHFRDHLENGAMAFDYRMHAGVVTKSNALKLMRAIGLDV